MTNTTNTIRNASTVDVALSPSPVRTLSLLVNGETVHVEEDHRALCADAINAGQG